MTIFFQPQYFNTNAQAIIPAYWGFYNDNGILQCFDTEAEAIDASRSQ